MIQAFSPNLCALADEELMSLVYDGDTRAFEVIFDRHAGVAFSLAYRMCGRRPLAEEIVQEAFMSLWRSTARYDPSRGSVRSWVLRVVHNRAIDAFRRELPSASHDVPGDWISEVLPARERTEDEVERRSDARLVRTALDELPAGPAAGDRARVLRRFLPCRDRRGARRAGGHGQGPDAPGAEQAAHRAG